MQDIDKSMVKALIQRQALKAIVAQMKAIAEEFQISKSVALQILEDACAAARAIGGWDLYVREAQGTGRKRQGTGRKRQGSGECGHKRGEGACKAKEEAQAPVPVSKPAAPEVAPEATDLIKTVESVWSEGTNEIEVSPTWVDSQNRVTIPLHIIGQAKRINGTLKRGGALTVIKGDGKVTVLFGDKSAEHEGASVVHLNSNGKAQFCVSPAFTCGDAVKCSLLKDGAIAITQLSEDELFDLI